MFKKYTHYLFILLGSLFLTSLYASHHADSGKEEKYDNDDNQHNAKKAKVLQLINNVAFEKDENKARTNLIAFGAVFNKAIQPLLRLKWEKETVEKLLEGIEDKQVVSQAISQWANNVVEWRNRINIIEKVYPKVADIVAKAMKENFTAKIDAFTKHSKELFDNLGKSNNTLGLEYKKATDKWHAAQTEQIALWYDAVGMLQVLADKILKESADKAFIKICLENFREATGLGLLSAQEHTKLLLKSATLAHKRENHIKNLKKRLDAVVSIKINIEEEYDELGEKNKKFINKILDITDKLAADLGDKDAKKTENIKKFVKNIVPSGRRIIVPSYIYNFCVDSDHPIFTKDNKYIIDVSLRSIRIIDFHAGIEVHNSPLLGHQNDIGSIAVTDDNKYIVSGGGSWDACEKGGMIYVWDFKRRKALSYSPLTDCKSGPHSVTITKDNKYIVSVSRDGIHIWKLTTGEELLYSLFSFGKGFCVHGITVTNDNKHILGYNDGCTYIWDFNTGKQVAINTLTRARGSLESIVISKDYKYIIGVGVDGDEYGVVSLWAAKTGKQICDYRNTFLPWLRSLAITNDNKYVITTGFASFGIYILELVGIPVSEIAYRCRLPVPGRNCSILMLSGDNKYIFTNYGAYKFPYVNKKERSHKDKNNNSDVFDIE